MSMHQPVEDAVSVDPWGFFDAPFVHTAKSLDTFLLFLQDNDAKEWEVSRMACYSATFRLVGKNGSEVYWTAQTTNLSEDDRRHLRGALSCCPPSMSRFSRERLAGVVGAYLGPE